MSDDTRNDSNDDAADATVDMNDERFGVWLQSAARDYNRPGDAIPREAMWTAIERAAPVVDIPSRAPRRLTPWWQAAAALLLVAGGIGIGRQWQESSSGGAPSVARQDSVRERPASAGDAPAAVPLRPAPQVALVEPSALATGGDPAGGTRPAARRAAPRSNESYDMAAVEHLSRAEALLTSFRTPRSGTDGTPLNGWARDLLADTRLLLDSPAASDARRRQLLEDLELVLAQIVQLPAESSADRGLVQRAIERGAVLSRLRSSIPAGFSSGT